MAAPDASPDAAPAAPVFDADAARAAGATDQQIANFLAPKRGFDLEGARNAGASYGEIVNFLAPPPVEPPPAAPVRGTLAAMGARAARAPTEFASSMIGGAGAITSGVGSLLNAGARGSDEFARSQIDIMNRIDAGGHVNPMDDPLGYADATPDLRATMRADYEKALGEMPGPEQSPLGVAGGALQAAGGAVRGAGEAVKAYGEAAHPLTEEEQQRWLVRGTGAITGLLPYLGAAALGGVPAIIGVAGVEGFGQGYDAAKAKGASDDDAAVRGTLEGLVSAGMMVVPLHKALDVAAALPGMAKGEFIKGLVEMAKSGATLSTFAELQNIADNAVAKVTQEPERPLTAGFGQNAGVNFVAGAIIPGFAAAMHAGASRVGAALRPRPTVPDVLNAGSVDDAINAANAVASSSTPIDAADHAATLDAGDGTDQQQAKLLRMFQSIPGTGAFSQAADGTYQVEAADPRNGQQTTIPVKVWDPDGPTDEHATGPIIAPDEAQAIRDHYAAAGVDTVFYQDHPAMPFDGAVDPDQPDTIFVSNNPARAVAQVAGHEFSHVLATTTLPDGTSLGDLLNRQIAAGITPAGQAHAEATFGVTAPKREALPPGPLFDRAHEAMVQAHLVNELGADIGAEAPRFQSFLPRVVDAIQARFGDTVAGDVLRKLIAGLRSAVDTIRDLFHPTPGAGRDLFGDVGTQSQNWVTNLGDIHDTLAQMYAERFGSPVERQYAAEAGAREQAARDRFVTDLIQRANLGGQRPAADPQAKLLEQTEAAILRPVGGDETALAPEQADRLAQVRARREALEQLYTQQFGSPGTLTLRRWLASLAAERDATTAASPQAKLLQQTEAAILRPVGGDEAALAPEAQARLGQVRAGLVGLLRARGDTPAMAAVRNEIEATKGTPAAPVPGTRAPSAPPTPRAPADARTLPRPVWMNEGEIDQAIDQFANHPVLGPAARWLGAYRDAVNQNSDGWAHWAGGANPAKQLMGLISAAMHLRESERFMPTAAEIKRASVPIKAAITKHGFNVPEMEAMPEAPRAPAPAAAPETPAAPAAAVTGAEAERLYTEAQAIMRKLPNDIGKAKREGRWTAAQQAMSDRLEAIDKVLPSTGAEYRRIYDEHRARIEQQRAEQSAATAVVERQRLADAGFAEGDKVYAIQPGALPHLAGRRLDGVVKIGKDGTAYVAADGKRLDPFSNPWRKNEAAAPPAARKDYDPHLRDPGEIAANKLAVDALNGDITQKDAVAGLASLVRQDVIPEGVARVNLSRLTDWTEGEWKALTAPAPRTINAPPPVPEQQKPGYGAGNKVFTADMAAEARAKLKARLNRLNAGFDPELAYNGMILAGFHIEAGARRFADYVHAMIDDLGELARPHLENWYATVRGQHGFDATGMDDQATVDAELKRQAEAPIVPSKELPDGGDAGPANGEVGAPGSGEAGGRGNGPGEPAGGGPSNPLAPKLPGPLPEPGAGAPGSGNGVRPGSEAVSGDDAVRGGGNADGGRPGAGGPRVVPDGPGGRQDAAKPTPDPVRPNFHIDDPERLVGGTPKVRFARNRSAIEAFRAIEGEQRAPTPDEMEAMGGFTGWGSFGQELFQGTWDKPKVRPEWRAEDQYLREHLGKDEWESAQRSIINAHYTDPPTVKAMWDIVQRMGFKGGRILEPSMGIGNFFGLMPRDVMRNSTLTGIELDRLTGGMAKLLYPDAGIHIKGFQDSHTPDGFYDLVIGNWPFGRSAPADRRYDRLSPSLHDYFFLKALDQTRPGGLVVGITSRYSMDAVSRATRLELATKGELVAAFRLPSGAFEKYAGTSVVTDIIVLRKRPAPIADAVHEPWVDSSDIKTPAGTDVRINNYYIEHPENVLGTVDFGHGTTTGREGMIIHRPADLMQRLETLADRVPTDGYQPIVRGNEPRFITNNTTDRQHSLVVGNDGQIYQVHGERLIRLDDISKTMRTGSAKVIKARLDQVTRLIGMRKAYGALIDAERDGAPNTEALRQDLARQYNEFKSSHGLLKGSTGLALLDRLNDPAFAPLAALERPDGSAARILSEPTIRSRRNLENPSVTDAYVMARNETPILSLDRVAELAGQPRDVVERNLIESGAVYRTPGGGFEPSDQYLGGNVRRKLREAQQAVANGDQDMQPSVDALTRALPKTVPYYQIEAKLGAPWVGDAAYRAFIGDLLGLDAGQRDDVHVRFAGSRWKVTFGDHDINRRPEATDQWGHPRYPFNKLVMAAMGNNAIRIMDPKDDKGGPYLNAVATEEVNAKVQGLREKFSEWAWQDPERKILFEGAYNEVMNAIAKPHFDGSFLDMSGMALRRGNDPFSLRQHQVNAIWRGVITGRGLFAHEVGTGKTYTMGGIAVEGRRYGVFRKPLIFAHNANSESVAADIQEMYPGAKVLYVNNLAPDEIATTLHRIANDDWDAVVMPHSLIDRMTMKRETLMELAADEIAELEAEAIEAAAEDGATLTPEMMSDAKAMAAVRSPTAKQLVHQRQQIINNIEKQANRSSKEGAIPFEDLGIDAIMVDEAHEFKKPPIATRMRLRGLNTQTSNRSIALKFLTGYVTKNNDGNGTYLFTGTPVTNTLNEIFNMSRYFMGDTLKRSGIESWDTWFNTFADASSDVELTATGDYEPIKRLASFNNVDELVRLMSEFTDVVEAKDMPEFVARATPSGKTLGSPDLSPEERDFLENGRSVTVGRPYKRVITDVGEMTPAQAEILATLRQYAQEFKDASPKDRREMMLHGDPRSPILVETAAANASLDARLYDPQAPNDPNNKINRVARNVLKVYQEPGAAQVIFVDRGYNPSKTSKGSTNPLTVTKALVDTLVAGGIPRNEIAIVAGGMAPSAKKAIADEMNAGTKRVVIGQSGTLGVGVNMQRQLRAMHHMDAPWRPGDLEQRNGRGERQGNEWNTVLEYRYVTEGIDGRRWQVLTTKEKFIKQFVAAFNDTSGKRLGTIEGDAADISDDESIMDTLSAAAGDPRIMVRAKAAADVDRLERRERMHTYGQADAAARAKDLRAEARGSEAHAAELQPMLDQWDAAEARATDAAIEAGAIRRMPNGSLLGHRWYEATIAGNPVRTGQEIQDALDAQVATLAKGDRKTLGTINGFTIKAAWKNDAGTEAVFDLVAPNGRDAVPIQLPTMPRMLAVINNTRRIAKEAADVTDKIASAERLEAAAQESFPQQAKLDQRREQLRAIELDLQVNPIPPPSWLRHGAPIDSTVYVNGQPRTVTGHRMGDDYLVTTDEGDVPYRQARDANGGPIYEVHPPPLDARERAMTAFQRTLAASDKSVDHGGQLWGIIRTVAGGYGVRQTTLDGEHVTHRSPDDAHPWTKDEAVTKAAELADAVKPFGPPPAAPIDTGTPTRGFGIQQFRGEPALQLGDRGILFSPRITGADRETEAYTPEQLAAYSRVGRVTDEPGWRARLATATDDLGRRALRYTLDPYIGVKRDDPAGYMALRNANTTAGASLMFLTDGTLKFDGSTYAMADRNGGVEHALIRPLQGEQDRFLWWVAAHRAGRLAQEDRENLWSPEDIAAIKGTNRGQTGFDYKLPNGAVTRSREAIYADSLRKLDVFNRNVMDLAVESGLLDRGKISAMLANPFYVPFYRQAEDTGQFAGPRISPQFVKQYAFKQLKGGAEKLNHDLWQNAIGNWSHMIDASLRNRAAADVLDTASTNGGAHEVTPQEYEHQMTERERKAATWVMKDGERQYYAIDDKMLYTAITALNFNGFNNPIMKAVGKFKQWLTIGVTSNPLFMLRVSIRDAEQAVATAPMSYNVLGNIAKGFRMGDLPGALQNVARAVAGQETHRHQLSDRAADVTAGGGTMHLGSGVDTGIRKTDLATMLDTPNAIAAFWKRIGTIGKAYHELTAMGEDVHRFALYDKLIAEGVPHDAASFAARDLEDFTLRGAGTIVRGLTQMVPFMNAWAQGLYKVGRAAVDSDRNITTAVGGRLAASATRRVITVLGATTLLTLALDALYQDDEDYKKRTEDDRNSNFWFKFGGVQFRIPMGFEIAALSRIASNGVEAFFDKEMTARRFFNNVGSIFASNLSMNPTPQIIRPALDLAMNQSSTGAPIVPEGMKTLRSEYQYNANTTLLARGIGAVGAEAARAVGGPQARFLSPLQLDYLTKGYFGWLGSMITGTADRAARQFAPVPARPAMDVLSFVTGGMVTTQPDSQSRYVDLLYQQAAGINAAFDTYRKLLLTGRAGEAREFFAENKGLIARHSLVAELERFEATQEQIARRIENNPNFSPEQKRIKLMAVNAARNRMAERAFGGAHTP